MFQRFCAGLFLFAGADCATGVLAGPVQVPGAIVAKIKARHEFTRGQVRNAECGVRSSRVAAAVYSGLRTPHSALTDGWRGVTHKLKIEPRMTRINTDKRQSGERTRPGCSFPRPRGKHRAYRDRPSVPGHVARNSGTRGAFRHTRGRVCSPGGKRSAGHRPGALRNPLKLAGTVPGAPIAAKGCSHLCLSAFICG